MLMLGPGTPNDSDNQRMERLQNGSASLGILFAGTGDTWTRGTENR